MSSAKTKSRFLNSDKLPSKLKVSVIHNLATFVAYFIECAIR